MARFIWGVETAAISAEADVEGMTVDEARVAVEEE